MDFETWQLVVTLQLVVAHCIHNNTNNNNNNNNNINSNNNNKHMRSKVIVILIGVQGAQHLLSISCISHSMLCSSLFQSFRSRLKVVNMVGFIVLGIFDTVIPTLLGNGHPIPW